jgi:chromosome segregation ATPase
MSDHIRTTCPNCRSVLRVRSEYVGKRVVCKHCGDRFTVTEPTAEMTSDFQSVAFGHSPPTAGLPTETYPELTSLAGLTETIEKVNREGARLRSELEKARAQSTRLQQDLEAARREAAEAEAARAECDQLRLDLDASNDEALRLRSEVDDLTSLAEQLRAEHEADLATFGQEAEETRRSWDSERTSMTADWESRWQSSEAEAAQLNDEVGALGRRLEEARDSAEAARDDAQTEKARLDAAVETARTEAEGLRSQLGETHKELDQLRGECQRLRTDGSRLDEAMREAEAAHRSEVEALRREVGQLREQHAAAGRQAEEHTRLAESLRGDLESTRKQKEEAARAAAEALEQHRNEHLGDRQEWNAERDRISAESSAARDSHVQAFADLEGRHTSLAETHEGLAKELEQATAARAQLEAEVAEVRKENEEVKAQLVLAQDFRHQIRTFLAGLGIKLPS